MTGTAIQPNMPGARMLKLSSTVFEKIRSHGEAGFPNECCGVLLGKMTGEQRNVLEILQIQNSFEAGEQFHRFLITPEDYRAAERVAREKKIDILGFYHSHPNSPSVASKYDLDHAFPWFSYLIISVMKGTYHDLHSWVMENDRSNFQEEHVVIE